MTEPLGQTNTGPSASDRDAETASLLLASDPEGLRRLVDDHASRVRATLRADLKKVLDHSEIDDALSQATHRVWRARPRIDLRRGTLRAWYYTIARNCALRILEAKRSPNALRFVEDLDSLAWLADTAREGVGPPREELVRALHRAIDELPIQQRAVILADLAAGGVAETEHLEQQLHTTRNAIYVARATARKALRTRLTAQGYPAAGEEPKGRTMP